MAAASVRRATPDDIESMTELVLSFRDFLESSDPGRAEIAASLGEVLNDPRAVVLLGFVDDSSAPNGYAHMRVFTSFWTSGQEAYLDDLYVTPAARSRGLGAVLLRAAFDEARALGATAIALNTNERNERAQAFYLAHGFRVSGEVRWGRGREIRLSRPL